MRIAISTVYVIRDRETGLPVASFADRAKARRHVARKGADRFQIIPVRTTAWGTK